MGIKSNRHGFVSRLSVILVSKRLLTFGRSSLAALYPMTKARLVIAAVSAINCQKSWRGIEPITLRTPTSLPLRNAWAVARLIKLTLAVSKRKRPIQARAQIYFLFVSPPNFALKWISDRGWRENSVVLA